MSESWQFTLGDLVLTGRCNFLSTSELESWVEGALSVNRLEAWEEHRLHCPACVELNDDAATFRQLVGSPLAIASELKAFQARDPQVRDRVGLATKKRRSKSWSWFWFSVPATIMATILVAMIWVGGGSVERLLGEVETLAFVPPPLVRGTMSDAWSQAEKSWQRGDYLAVAQTLGTAWGESPTRPDMGHYLAYAQLQIDQPAAAARTLEQVEQLEGAAVSEWTLWLAAHAADRSGDRQRSCSQLERVIAFGGRHETEAQAAFDRGCR